MFVRRRTELVRPPLVPVCSVIKMDVNSISMLPGLYTYLVIKENNGISIFSSSIEFIWKLNFVAI
jgi:hypothetical protein